MAQKPVRIKEVQGIQGPWSVTYVENVQRCVDPQCPSEFLIRVFGTSALAKPDASIRDALFRSDFSFLTSTGNIPRFTVGSVWEDGVKTRQLYAPRRSFSISPAQREIVGYNGLVGERDRQDFIFSFREWPELPLESKTIRFCVLEGQSSGVAPMRVIIPCAEVVRFFFGSSSNLLDALFCSSPGDERSQIFVPETSGWDVDGIRYFVELGLKMINSDASVIARIATDDCLRRSAESIARSLHRYRSDINSRSFSCSFPISGPCRLTTSGFECRSRAGVRQFFVQAIHDCRDDRKPFEVIFFRRRDSRKAEADDELEPTSGVPPVNAPAEIAEIAKLSSGTPSSDEFAPSTIYDSDFVNPWLRNPAYRTRQIDKRSQKTEPRRGQNPSGEADSFATCQDKTSDGRHVPLIQTGSPEALSEDFAADDETGTKFALVIKRLQGMGFATIPERIGVHKTESGFHSIFSAPTKSKWFEMTNLTPVRPRRLYIVKITGASEGKIFVGYLVEIETRGTESFSLVLIYSESVTTTIHRTVLEIIVGALGKAHGKWRKVKPDNGVIKRPFDHPPFSDGDLSGNEPTTDEKYANAQSAKIRREVVKIVKEGH